MRGFWAWYDSRHDPLKDLLLLLIAVLLLIGGTITIVTCEGPGC